jgi:hypothetical protein
MKTNIVHQVTKPTDLEPLREITSGAIALYERAEPKLQAARIQSILLAAESLQHLIAECAIDNNLIFL